MAADWRGDSRLIDHLSAKVSIAERFAKEEQR